MAAASYATVISTVKLIIEALTPTTSYLRARNLSEANAKVLKTLLDKPVAIHGNLPLITSSGTPITGNFLQAFPLEVWFMDKLAKDAEGAQVDTSLQITKDLLDQLADRLGRSVVIDEANFLPEYTAEAVRTRFTDDILTGWLFTASIPVQRPNYCLWLTLFHIYSAFTLEQDGWLDAASTGTTLYTLGIGWNLSAGNGLVAKIELNDKVPQLGDTLTLTLEAKLIALNSTVTLVTILYGNVTVQIDLLTITVGDSFTMTVTDTLTVIDTPSDYRILLNNAVGTTAEIVVTKFSVKLVTP